VKAEDVTYYDKYPANTVALNSVDVRAQVQGYITAMYFKEGSHVGKGQKLYDIDKRLYQQAYDAAAANLRVAQGTELQSQQDADRYIYLNKENAIAKQVLDHAMITLQNSKSQTQSAEEAKKTAATNLGYATIYAPFDGTIGFSQVKLGGFVTAGSTVLNTVSSNNPIAVDFLINEKQLMHYEEIQKGKGGEVDSLFTMLLPNGSLYPHQGKISIIDRAVDPQTGSIKVRLVFPNPDDYLKAGMSVVLRVHNQESAPQLVIPNKAVVEQMGEYFVYVAKDTVMSEKADANMGKGSGGSDAGAATKNASSDPDKPKKEGSDTATKKPKLRAIQRKVKLGQTIGANIIVLSGINDGDKIVVDGLQSIHDGSAISTGGKNAANKQEK
jgi:membrane fusion protein (multidrug efflux system)